MCLADVSGQQVFNTDWKIANPHAGGVVHRRRNRRSNASQPNLSNASGSILAHDRIGDVKEVNVDLWRIGDSWNNIIREVVVDRMSVARVVDRLFKQSHSDSHHNCASDLVGRRPFVDNAAAIDDADNSAYAELGDSWIPFNLDELGSKGVH